PLGGKTGRTRRGVGRGGYRRTMARSASRSRRPCREETRFMFGVFDLDFWRLVLIGVIASVLAGLVLVVLGGYLRRWGLGGGGEGGAPVAPPAGGHWFR